MEKETLFFSVVISEEVASLLDLADLLAQAHGILHVRDLVGLYYLILQYQTRKWHIPLEICFGMQFSNTRWQAVVVGIRMRYTTNSDILVYINTVLIIMESIPS